MTSAWSDFRQKKLKPLRHVTHHSSLHPYPSYPLLPPPMASPAHLSHTPTLPHPSHAHAKKNPAASAGLAACGRARSYRAPENLMPEKFCALAATGAHRVASSNQWGNDPHWKQTPPLTVLRAGGALSSHPRPGGARIWPRRAPQTTGALVMQRRTPQHAAASLTHARTPPQHLP